MESVENPFWRGACRRYLRCMNNVDNSISIVIGL